jgi:hypothetical protein
MSAREQRLYERLVSVLAWDTGTPRTKEGFREAITAHRVAGAVCARVTEVGGKPLCFQKYYEALFNEQLDGKPLKKKAAKA